jgi:hypothetical protein
MRGVKGIPKRCCAVPPVIAPGQIVQVTPHRKTWHVERDGEILEAGVGLSGCARGPDCNANVKRVVDHIERVAYGPSPSTRRATSSMATHADGVTVEHDRDWTWIAFDTKPTRAVRDRLKEVGARWSRRRQRGTLGGY